MRVRTFQQHGLLASLVAIVSIFPTGCHFKGAGFPDKTEVIGNTYATSAGDTIKFLDNGRAVEINGKPAIYRDQMVDFDSTGRYAQTECTYKQDGRNVTLTCEPKTDAVFTVNADGSLTGPPGGLWGHPVFSQMVLVNK